LVQARIAAPYTTIERSMANSLRDQLIKAGLADQAPSRSGEPPAKPRSRTKAKDKAKPERAAASRTRRSTVPRDPALDQERRELRAMEQARLREEKQAQAAARAIQQRRDAVRDFLLRQQQNDRAGDIPFHFQAAQRIRRLYVTAAQRQALLAGELQVAVLGKRDFLITPTQAGQALVLDAGLFIYDATQAGEDCPAEDDGYGDYAVPDDLMW
jgi:uncharacterized protein YaiL (DUF2058 family)